MRCYGNWLKFRVYSNLQRQLIINYKHANGPQIANVSSTNLFYEHSEATTETGWHFLRIEIWFTVFFVSRCNIRALKILTLRNWSFHFQTRLNNNCVSELEYSSVEGRRVHFKRTSVSKKTDAGDSFWWRSDGSQDRIIERLRYDSR